MWCIFSRQSVAQILASSVTLSVLPQDDSRWGYVMLYSASLITHGARSPCLCQIYTEESQNKVIWVSIYGEVVLKLYGVFQQ